MADRNIYSWTTLPSPSHLEAETATAKFKKYKSPGSEQIPAGMIQAGGET
jgi:hypothetical protein